MGHYSEISELPEVIQKGLKEVGYNRKDIKVEVREQVCIRPPSANGCRGFAVACLLDGSQEFRVTWGSWGGSNMFTTTVDDVQESVPTPPNSAFIMGSSGGNKPTYAYLVIGPGNVNPQLLPPAANVSDHEAKILAIFNQLKSSARKEYLGRMGAKSEEVDSLVERGYLKRNKAGATSITTQGRNAAGRSYY